MAVAIICVLSVIAGGSWPVGCIAGDVEETARVIAGFQAAPNHAGKAEESLWRTYSHEVATFWNDYERRIGRPLHQWACQELDRAEGATVFYPFSGPDLPWAFHLFPDADRYVLVALERAEAPPRLESFSKEELEGYMAVFRKAWRFYGALGFFRTNDLIEETKAQGTRLGITGPLLAFAVRMGFEVEAIEPIQLEGDGSGVSLRDRTSGRPDTWDSVRLSLRKNQRRITVDYVRIDLSDASLAKEAGALRWLERMAANPTILKAASHHLQEPGFSIVRRTILQQAPIIVQDEAGLEYGALAEAFSVRLYGKFTHPNRAFPQDFQRALAAAYRSRPGVKPLPFQLGYDKDAGSAMQVATRGPNFAQPRACALPEMAGRGGRSARIQR